MNTELAAGFKQSDRAKEAAGLIQKCVHCGFCAATCPTYLITGHESDSPRGRIYLVKSLLEGAEPSAAQPHLDSCLLCRSCETTCPSGVVFAHILEIGREVVATICPPDLKKRLKQKALTSSLPYAGAVTPLMNSAGQLQKILPKRMKAMLPTAAEPAVKLENKHARKMLLLQGCVQSVLSPQTNISAISVFGQLGISLLPEINAGCCGAVKAHTGDASGGLLDAKKRIDAWWPMVESGEIEAIVSTASGCGLQAKEYGYLLRNDIQYAAKAEAVSACVKDVAQVLLQEADALKARDYEPRFKTIAYHPPCTLQHGQKLPGVVEAVLSAAGFDVHLPVDAHLCCGSAGTYALFHPEMSSTLKQRKLKTLAALKPDVIVTANIGCQQHLKTSASVPVLHWLQLLA